MSWLHDVLKSLVSTIKSRTPAIPRVVIQPGHKDNARKWSMIMGMGGTLGLAVLSAWGVNTWLGVVLGVLSLLLPFQQMNDQRDREQERIAASAQRDILEDQVKTLTTEKLAISSKYDDARSIESGMIDSIISALAVLLNIALDCSEEKFKTRVSLYVMTPRDDEVRLVARATQNPELESEPRKIYPKKGAILKAWTDGSHIGELLPSPVTALTDYIEWATTFYEIPRNRVRQSRMKPRRYFAWQIHGHTGTGSPCGVVSVECQHEGEELAALLPLVVNDPTYIASLSMLAYQVQEYWRRTPPRSTAVLEG